MPANRSRTLEWRRCLKQVHERGGSLEVAIAHVRASDEIPADVVEQSHLVWRVRILSLTESEILVEQPTTLGQVIEIDRGTTLLFHCVEIADGTRTIPVGQPVEFDLLRKFGADEASNLRPT